MQVCIRFRVDALRIDGTGPYRHSSVYGCALHMWILFYPLDHVLHDTSRVTYPDSLTYGKRLAHCRCRKPPTPSDTHSYIL